MTSNQREERRKAVIGVSSEGLQTAVLPKAIAGAIFHVSK
jgi:hypothetical protein